MSQIYFYKLTVDDGGAPCAERGLLSLAICKPMIRRTAQKGDLIFGFAGNLKSKHLRAKFSETRWENLLPVEDAADLPAGYEAARELLDEHRLPDIAVVGIGRE